MNKMNKKNFYTTFFEYYDKVKNPTQLLILFYLDKKQMESNGLIKSVSISVSKIATALGLTVHTTTTSLNILIDKGYIVKHKVSNRNNKNTYIVKLEYENNYLTDSHLTDSHLTDSHLTASHLTDSPNIEEIEKENKVKTEIKDTQEPSTSPIPLTESDIEVLELEAHLEEQAYEIEEGDWDKEALYQGKMEYTEELEEELSAIEEKKSHKPRRRRPITIAIDKDKDKYGGYESDEDIDNMYDDQEDDDDDDVDKLWAKNVIDTSKIIADQRARQIAEGSDEENDGFQEFLKMY